MIGDDTMMELIAEQLDIDLDKLKASMPKPEDDPVIAAQQKILTTPTEETPTEGEMSA